MVCLKAAATNGGNILPNQKVKLARVAVELIRLNDVRERTLRNVGHASSITHLTLITQC
jgi:hypothetical protein